MLAMERLRFLIDEDLDVKIVPFFRSRGHDVIEARELFGVQTQDKENLAWCRANLAILVTGDWKFVSPRRASHRRAGVLCLRGLEGHQLRRVTELSEDIEREARLRGDRLFMWIGREEFNVLR